MYEAKTKALISFAVSAKLISVFVFAYAKSRISQDAAHIFPLEGGGGVTEVRVECTILFDFFVRRLNQLLLC